MEKRYRVLRVVAGFYKILGLLIGGIGILAAIFGFVAVLVGGSQLNTVAPAIPQAYPFLSGGGIVGLIIGILVLLVGVLLTAALTFATGEGITVLMDVEENTRATGILLRQIRQGSQRRQDQNEPPA